MTGLLPMPDGGDFFDTYKTGGLGPQSATSPRTYTPARANIKPPPQAASASQRLDTNDLRGEDRDAASALIQLFRQYGLESLAPKIISYVRDGYGADTISLLLQDTPEWKQRFAGNEARRKAGLPVLSPSEYLATERSYRQVMEQFGMPAGFYDSYSDFADFIARDMSATELQGRVQAWSTFANNQDPSTKEALQRLYGIGPGELTAWAMDADRALPILQRQAGAVQAASAALRQGLGVDRKYAEHLSDLGIDAGTASQGYATVAEMLPTYQELSHIYGGQYNQRTAEQEVFEGNAGATQKRKNLASQERAAFGGSSRGQVGRSSSSY